MTKYTSSGTRYRANFINVYARPYPIAPSYSSFLEYADKMIEHYEIEDFIEKLKPLKFMSAKYIFLDNVFHSEILIRLQIEMDGEVKLNESSVVFVKIPYKEKKEDEPEEKT